MCKARTVAAVYDRRRIAMRPKSALIERRYKIALAYDGTGYGGWQLQPNAVTVQKLLEKALAKLAGKRGVVHGSGRTDAGVHAREQIASCSLATYHSPLVLCRALNGNLPDDIRVLRVQEVDAKFHARFSAKGKEYRYQIDAGKVADPFQRRYAWHHPRPLDVPAMRRAAKWMVGRHDFSALSVSRVRRDAAVVRGNPMRGIETPVRTVSRLTITRKGNMLTIAVWADGFLYKMVRSIVGALVKVGEGRLTVEQLRAVMAAKKRTALIETAPAKGLFLWKVYY
jgi:tRNA pseudouridine38-40 synthase